MRTVTGLWRWRRNPLRRGTDLIEAWVALAAVTLLALAVPAVGWFGGRAVDASMRQTIGRQHEQRHRTTAVVVHSSTDRHVRAFDAESAREHDLGRRVIANWRAADGSSHAGTVSSPLREPRPGDTFPIWADHRGRPVKSPMSTDAARLHAVLAGFGIAALTAGLVECARRLVVWHLVRRRYERLDEAWAEAGPDWGRTGAGS
ncbi:hypothetical protein [Streptomyces sp. NPDC056244]|uniref:Rv1733c family protein n=1 Tax=Streptomyces sp. NPDC056244 TaxID=3345762 RepID=UPI0035E1772D